MPVDEGGRSPTLGVSQLATGAPILDGRRRPSFGGTSRMTRECQVRICERLGVKLPGPTRQTELDWCLSVLIAAMRISCEAFTAENGLSSACAKLAQQGGRLCYLRKDLIRSVGPSPRLALGLPARDDRLDIPGCDRAQRSALQPGIVDRAVFGRSHWMVARFANGASIAFHSVVSLFSRSVAIPTCR